MASGGPHLSPSTGSAPGQSGPSLYDDMLGTGEDEEDGTLDPRVKGELESLNQAATDVNRLEKEIDLAREKYQVTFTESSQQLEVLKKKSRDSIKKARNYYEIKEAAKVAQSEALRSARKFQAANGVYLAAKETISLAELRLMDDKAVTLSAAWQEMMNHALLKVTDAEEEKTRAEKEHLKMAANFARMELQLHTLEKKQKRSIAKARVYFETKKELEVKLQQLKQTLEDLQQAMRSAKRRYSCSLHHLESISDGIHEKRRRKLMLMLPREPGVGAEETDDDACRARVPSLTSSSLTDDSLHTSGDLDDQSLTLHEDDEEIDDIDEEFLAYQDIQNESVFRAKVLSTALDDDDTSFMNRGAFREKKRLMRVQSLPMNIHQKSKTRAAFEFHTENNSEENLGFGSKSPSGDRFPCGDGSLKSERNENSPPDGDSLNHEPNCDCEDRDDDVNAGKGDGSDRSVELASDSDNKGHDSGKDTNQHISGSDDNSHLSCNVHSDHVNSTGNVRQLGGIEQHDLLVESVTNDATNIVRTENYGPEAEYSSTVLNFEVSPHHEIEDLPNDSHRDTDCENARTVIDRDTSSVPYEQYISENTMSSNDESSDCSRVGKERAIIEQGELGKEILDKDHTEYKDEACQDEKIHQSHERYECSESNSEGSDKIDDSASKTDKPIPKPRNTTQGYLQTNTK